MPLKFDFIFSCLYRIGSAIVVTVQRASPVFSQLVYNPQCFLIYENASRSPGQWDDVS